VKLGTGVKIEKGDAPENENVEEEDHQEELGNCAQ
jgi:hypothetical protein